MSERNTGILIGGIIALLGAISGLGIGFILPSQSGPLAFLTAPQAATWAMIVLILSIIALILSLMIVLGKMIKMSTIILLIIAILSLLGFMAGSMGVVPGIIELIGVIIAMVSGALK
ncbi:MAG: hypothetical protein QW279_15005 [Candidatus Jordarchaeaceae archaeon]